MVELGLYAVARVYWTIFSGPFGAHAGDLRNILIWMGVLTALVGAVMCLSQRHLKRLLAFSTISHVGIFLIGFALLTDRGLAGSATYVVAHGMAKASLFMCVGVLLHRFGSIEEHDLRGLGRRRSLAAVGVTVFAGGIVIACAPMFGTFFGKSMVEESSLALGYGWLPTVITIASALTGGAILRFGGRIFLGWGPAEEPDDFESQVAREEERETRRPHLRVPVSMVVPAVVLMAGAVVVGLVPGVVHTIEHAAAHFRDRAAYAQAVLHGHATFADTPPSKLTGYDFLYASAAVLGAFAVAAIGLFGKSLRESLPRPLLVGATRGLAGLRTLHSGHAGDYVMWVTVTLAALGGTFALALR
jgi:multicomponent Na+:H+ antiporter subunit D